MNSVLRAFIPVYGASTRFRLYLRLREFYRKHNMDFLATCLKVHLQKNYGCELSIHAEISPKAAFMHTVGIVIGEGVVVEDGVVFYSGVVLGRKNINDSNDYPTIKKNVVLSTGCTCLGKCIVNENCIIGAHALVLNDCVAGGALCRNSSYKNQVIAI